MTPRNTLLRCSHFVEDSAEREILMQLMGGFMTSQNTAIFSFCRGQC